MIQGMSRTLGRPRENQRKAFTVSLLRRWVVELGVPVHDWNYYTIFAGIAVCIFGMLRGAEGFARTAHHPVPEDTRRIQDLTIHEQEGYAVLHLATSKSDPFSEGVAIRSCNSTPDVGRETDLSGADSSTIFSFAEVASGT